jgi:excisionase family DNA binding protein
MTDTNHLIRAADLTPFPAESENDFLLSAEQVATLMRCTKEHVQTLARRRTIPGTKFGRTWVFVGAQIRQYVANTCADNIKAGIPNNSDTGIASEGSEHPATQTDPTGKVRAIRQKRAGPGRPRKDLGSWAV